MIVVIKFTIPGDMAMIKIDMATLILFILYMQRGRYEELAITQHKGAHVYNTVVNIFIQIISWKSDMTSYFSKKNVLHAMLAKSEE